MGAAERVFINLTADGRAVGSVVVVQDRGMKDIWCLAVSDARMSSSEAKKRYGKRFSCEETFRDLKDPRFGMGLSNRRVRIPSVETC